MLLVPLFLSVAFVVGEPRITFGRMYIPIIETIPGPRRVRVIHDTIGLSAIPTTFQYEGKGGIKKFNTNKFLSVADTGHLVMDTQPELGLCLTLLRGSDYMMLLSYKGNRFFYVCEDTSVNTKGNCENPRKVFIIFEDMFH